MKILFIWNYHYFPYEKGRSRFSDLLEELAKRGHQIEVICSTFYHMEKGFRDASDKRLLALPYKTTLIPEAGYQKNVSLKRWHSIRGFNKGVKKYLDGHGPVDLVYVPIPSNELSLTAESFAKRVGAKTIIDVEDLWPESFKMIPLVKPVYSLLFAGALRKRKRAFMGADGIVAVSQTYLQLGLSEAGKPLPSACAPIGAIFSYVSQLRSEHVSKKPNGEFWIGYIGTLSKSYDLYTAIDSVEALAIAHFDNIVLKIMGSGPDLDKVKAYASKKVGRYEFYGLLPYEQMCSILFDCDVGLNPIIASSSSSLINKVADYAACGVPVINSQQSKEYQRLVDTYNAGWNISAKDCIAMQKAIIFAMKHPTELSKKKEGALLLATKELNRSASQERIISLIENFKGGNR